MPRIAICDECFQDAEDLKKCILDIIESVYFESPADFQIVIFNSSKELISDLDFELVFINPEENETNDGMKAATTIRNLFKSTYICLVSSSDIYAINGYDILASGYLVKPIKKEKLEAYLNVIMNLMLITPSSIGICSQGASLRINPDKIVFLESRAKEVTFHFEKENTTVKGKLDKFANFLSLDFRFLRCHKSYLVNLNFVEEIKNYLVSLKNGDTLPIPKTYYRAVRLRFLMFKRREESIKLV